MDFAISFVAVLDGFTRDELFASASDDVRDGDASSVGESESATTNRPFSAGAAISNLSSGIRDFQFAVEDLISVGDFKSIDLANISIA